MLRNAFVIVVLALTLAGFAAPVRAAAPTIGIVDVEKIMSESKAAQDLKSQLDAKKESFQKEFSAKEKSLKEAEDGLLKERETLAPEEFAKKRKAYEEKVMDTRKLFQKSRNSLDEGLAAAMQTLNKSIVEATAAVAEEKGFDIVMRRDNVLIAANTLDITKDVLAKIDAKVTKIPLKVE